MTTHDTYVALWDDKTLEGSSANCPASDYRAYCFHSGCNHSQLEEKISSGYSQSHTDLSCSKHVLIA